MNWRVIGVGLPSGVEATTQSAVVEFSCAFYGMLIANEWAAEWQEVSRSNR